MKGKGGLSLRRRKASSLAKKSHSQLIQGKKKKKMHAIELGTKEGEGVPVFDREKGTCVDFPEREGTRYRGGRERKKAFPSSREEAASLSREKDTDGSVKGGGKENVTLGACPLPRGNGKKYREFI